MKERERERERKEEEICKGEMKKEISSYFAI
jgi:hypothetical protein